MFIFEANSRVQKTTEGIQFYEQDVLCSEYSFSGNQRIEIQLDYVSPGFGIAFIEENGPDLKDAYNAFLFKLGSGDFRVYRKHFKTQEELHVDSCTLFPGSDMKGVTLVFDFEDSRMTISRLLEGSNGDSHAILLGQYQLSKIFETFRIGIYSNAGNVIHSVNFQNSVPENWHVSVKNTMGGRIAFSRNTIRIENCEHYAEIQQDHIELEPGTYWLKYDTEPVNGICDVEAFILDPYDDPRSYDDELVLEDGYKNILREDNSFTIPDTMEVSLKFKAHNGIIRGITVTDNQHSSFIETKGDPYSQKGSDVTINLKNLTRVTWEATIYDVPPWEDLSRDCPYGIIESGYHRYNTLDLGVRLGVRYRYVYDVKNERLTVTEVDGKHEMVFQGRVPATVQKIMIMHNVTSTIFTLIISSISGDDINVMVRKTFKKYVSPAINSPIIVTKLDSDTPFELSSAYREIVSPKNQIQLFSKEHPLILKEEMPINASAIQVFGIPKGSSLNTTATEIKQFSNHYTEISDDDYERVGNSLKMEDKIRGQYEYIAVQYRSIQTYFYEFTNYEREIFDGKHDVISLVYAPAKREEDIIVYGIPAGTTIHKDYLYRVPSSSLINSIDYYADRYEIIPPNLYITDFDMRELLLNDSLISGRYQQFVVEYLKRDSYAINYRSQYAQYEVDIATNDNRVRLHYDMHDDGSTYDYIRTKIVPDKDKYIVMRRKEGAK